MTTKPKTILGVFAHPDDESMGPGATLAKYAAAGHRVAFVTANDGGAGRLFDERPADNTELRKLRRQETADAAAILGVEFLGFLGWEDRQLEGMSVLDIENEFAKIIRREKPDVVMTFHASGISYHPDHRVVALALNGAVLGSAVRGWYTSEEVEKLAPHRTAKFYYYTANRSLYESVKWPRAIYASEPDEITTKIDTSKTAEAKWKAIRAHKTQQNGPPFKTLYEAGVFEEESFVRVFPSWHHREPRETDLLSGLDD